LPITSAGLISNEKPQNGAKNPWETHYFEYQTKFEDPPDFCTHVAWSIYGDVPVGIKIDSGSGKISGTICHFGKQPSCQDNKPKEQLEFDGSNCDKNGRFKHQTYDFHFTIQRDTLVSGPNPSNGAMDCSIKISLIETNEVCIKVIKCHDIDNLIFIEQYLDEGKEGGNPKTGEKFPTSININGKKYFDSKSCKENHKGPFLRPQNC
jgi:hypothetical protein